MVNKIIGKVIGNIRNAKRSKIIGIYISIACLGLISLLILNRFAPPTVDYTGFIIKGSAFAQAPASDIYEVSGITIIDVQSYPTLYGNWTVRFNTTGTANLTITAVDNTEFEKDIEFLELRCGDSVLTTELTDGVVFVENYNCDETGYKISKVIIAGKHTLEFRFGNDVKYAYNEVEPPTYSLNSTNNTVAGRPTEFRLNWTDNIGLSGHIFSLCNGTWSCLSGEWWNSSFLYRKSLNITGSTAGNQTNYQMNITAINGTGTDSGATVYIDNKARSDFGDIRFVNSTNDELDYWMEKNYTGDNATFWVEIPFISNVINNTIYIYYGKNDATTTHDGLNLDLFQLREHDWFSSSSPDFSFVNATTSVNISSTASSRGEGYVFIIGDRSYLDGKKVRVYWRVYQAGNVNPRTIGHVHIVDHAHLRSKTTDEFQDNDDTTHPISDYTNIHLFSLTANYKEWTAWTTTTSTVMDLSAWTSDYVTLLIHNRDAWAGGATHTEVDYMQILDSGDNVLKTFDFTESIVMEQTGTLRDYGLYRKYSSPEPSHGGWGSEETGWTNDTWVSMTGTGNWSNVTKIINSEGGKTIKWRVYANDTSDNWNVSETFSFVTIDRTPPLWRNQTTNDTDNIINQWESINLTAQGYDETALDWALLSTNESGQWENKTEVSGWWNSSWNYRKQHKINGSSAGNQTNYQMNITVINGSGTDSGATLYIDNKARSDFGDIRFINSTDYELDYWIEKNYTGENATFWVEIPFISNVTDNTIYIYYGKNDATTTSNGTNTFIFFDDFLGVALDTNKWSSIGSVSVSDSICTVTRSGGINSWIKSLDFVSTNDTATRSYYRPVTRRVWMQNAYDDDNTMSIHHISTDDALEITSEEAGTNEQDRPETTDHTNYRTYEIRRIGGTSHEFYKDSTLLGIHSTYIMEENANITFLTWNDNGNNIKIDWVLVRKIIGSEPSHEDWGSEESSSYPSPIDMQDASQTWTWSNFTWTNNSVAEGTIVGWRIYYNDTNGNENVTNINTFSINIAPQWSNLQVSPASGSTYQPGQSYQFNATWTDNVAVSDVILEFNGTNYTYSLGEISKEGNVYNKTFDDLPAGTFSYVWYGNDTNDNWNSTRVTVIYQVSSSLDDDYAMSSNHWRTVGWVRWWYDDLTRGYFRWSIYIPADSTIVSAYFIGVAYDSSSGTVNTDIKLLDYDSCPAFSSNPYGWTVTDTTVNWNIGPWTAETEYMSPNISTLVQEFINRTSYNPSNYIGIRFRGTGGLGSKTVYSIDGSSSKAAKLEVTYVHNGTYIINKAATNTSLFLNGTEGDSEYMSDIANITATSNVSSLTVKIYSNYTNGLQEIASGTGSVINYTDTDNLALGWYLIKADTTENQNYTSSQINYTLLVWQNGTVSVDLNATEVSYADSINVSGQARYIDTGYITLSSVEAKISGNVKCTDTTDASGAYDCQFTAPNELGTFTVVVEVTDKNTSKVMRNSTSFTVTVVYGEEEKERIEAENIGCYEVPKIIQNPDGSIEKVTVRICVWE